MHQSYNYYKNVMTDYTCTPSIQEQTFCISWFSEFDGHVLIGGNSVPSEMASKSHSAGLAAILYFGGNNISIVKVKCLVTWPTQMPVQ